MLARSWLIYPLAAVLFASFSEGIAHNVAHAATSSNVAISNPPGTQSPSPYPSASPSPTPSPSASPSTITPFMHLRPIGKKAAVRSVGHAPAVNPDPSIFTVFQAGKAYKEKSDYNADGTVNKLVFEGRPSHGLSSSEKVVVDGSIQVQLLPFDLSIPKPQGDAYMVKIGNNKPCWIISGLPATKHPYKPVTLYDDRSKAVVTIYTQRPINAGPCAP